jgi:hypothetical protein
VEVVVVVVVVADIHLQCKLALEVLQVVVWWATTWLLHHGEDPQAQCLCIIPMGPLQGPILMVTILVVHLLREELFMEVHHLSMEDLTMGIQGQPHKVFHLEAPFLRVSPEDSLKDNLEEWMQEVKGQGFHQAVVQEWVEGQEVKYQLLGAHHLVDIQLLPSIMVITHLLHHLMPHLHPHHPHLQVAVQYLPAGQGMLVCNLFLVGRAMQWSQSMRGSCQRWVDERWKEASNLEMFFKSSMIFALRLSWLFGGEKRVQHVRVFSVAVS